MTIAPCMWSCIAITSYRVLWVSYSERKPDLYWEQFILRTVCPFFKFIIIIVRMVYVYINVGDFRGLKCQTPLELELQAIMNCFGCWELSLGLLKEQYVLSPISHTRSWTLTHPLCVWCGIGGTVLGIAAFQFLIVPHFWISSWMVVVGSHLFVPGCSAIK